MHDILFINIESDYLVTPLEGGVSYANYYIDLSSNKSMTVREVLDKLNVRMNDFNSKCISCPVDGSLDNFIRLMPVGSFLYVDSMVMGTFSDFVVSYQYSN